MFPLALISAIPILTGLTVDFVDEPGHFDYMGGVANASISEDPWLEIDLIYTPEKSYPSDTRLDPYPVKVLVPKVYFNSSVAELRIMPCAANWGNKNANYTCTCSILETGPRLIIELQDERSRSPLTVPFGPPSRPYDPPSFYLTSGNFTLREYENGTLESTAFRSGFLDETPYDKISNMQVNITAWNGSQAVMEHPGNRLTQHSPETTSGSPKRQRGQQQPPDSRTQMPRIRSSCRCHFSTFGQKLSLTISPAPSLVTRRMYHYRVTANAIWSATMD